ncbi:MAG TPA: enoyl-CoA hydratase-related protein [Acidobacteriaceae bacterium]|nr:enoyl-CoA hydratase-related protein [Acidobacteriaceae bacterium]
MQESALRVHNDGGVVTLTLHRPEKRNALNAAMMAELTQALNAAVSDAACRVVVLTGAGEAFCAGMDLGHLESLGAKTQQEHREDSEQIARLLRTLYELPKPTIAAVNGAAIAGGMGLATVCDFTLAVPEAKFGYTEVRIGFVAAIVSAFLREQIGDKQARDLLLTGRLIQADEAHVLGLVTRVVAAAELMDEARKLAGKLMENSPQALEATKRLLSEQVRDRLNKAIALAVEANVQARATKDFKEGIRAFLEKRKPKWD